MQRWGITPAEFDTALARYRDDEALYGWLVDRVPTANIRAANQWLVDEKMENLERQDAEENVSA